MACSKYSLTNTGTTLTNFNYRRCDDAMWQYQVSLEPNQTKNIWLIDNTFSTSFVTGIVLTNEGERLFDPTFGGNIRALIFEQDSNVDSISESLKDKIAM